MSTKNAERASIASRLVAAWRRFWFTPASLVDLGISRIVLAAIALYLNGSMRFLGAVLPPADLWSPIELVRLLGLERPSWSEVLWYSKMLRWSLVAAALGLFTRAALSIAFVLELLQEAFLNSHGKVTHGTIPLLYALLAFALSPCDRAVSLDALRRRWWARLRGRPTPQTPSQSSFARWPLEVVFIELAAYYFLAGVAKVQASGLAWTDGFTLQYHLLEKATPAGLWLASRLELCQAFSALVLLFELGFPVAIFLRRLRPIVLIAGVLFHLGTIVFLRISFWPVWTLYALFIPWSRLGALLLGSRRRAKLRTSTA